MGGRFLEFLQSTEPPLPTRLPLCHATEAFFGEEVVRSGLLRPVPCRLFKEPLIYFFYGKSSFRSKPGDPSLLNAFYPMLFVVEFEEHLHKPKRIFPFDTGAYADGYYKTHMHDGMRIDEFEITQTPDIAQKHVKTFFGSNAAYVRGTPRSGLNYPATNFYVDSFYKLISGSGQAKGDDRRATLELQIDHEISLQTTHFVAVIVPEVFMDDADFVAAVRRVCRIEPTPYRIRNASSASWYGALEAEADKLIESRYL